MVPAVDRAAAVKAAIAVVADAAGKEAIAVKAAIALAAT